MENYVKHLDDSAAQAVLSDRASYELLRLLRLCTATGKPALVVIALRTIQQLIANRCALALPVCSQHCCVSAALLCACCTARGPIVTGNCLQIDTVD